jgi:hypothetical protein
MGWAFPPNSPQQHLLESVIGRKSQFLAHFDDCFTQVPVVKKTRDEYHSAIREFAISARQPLESLSGSHAQGGINELMADDDAGDDGRIDDKTVKKSGIKNYWRY